MSHRKCKMDPDKILVHLWRADYKKKQKDNDRSHKENLFCIPWIGDQDKPWAPHYCCSERTNNLNLWFSGKKQSVGFAVPMIWREQIDHTGCYSCISEIEGFNQKTKQNITPLGQNICILFYFQAFCKFLGL